MKQKAIPEIMERTRFLIAASLEAILRARDLREVSSDLRFENADYRDYVREQRLNALARYDAWSDGRGGSSR